MAGSADTRGTSSSNGGAGGTGGQGGTRPGGGVGSVGIGSGFAGLAGNHAGGASGGADSTSLAGLAGDAGSRVGGGAGLAGRPGLPGVAAAAIAVALAQSVHFSASSTAIGDPASLYLGLLAKVAAVALCLGLPPRRPDGRPNSGLPGAGLPFPPAAAALGCVFALSVALLYAPLPAAALLAASFAFYFCEMACYILSGLVAIELAGRDVVGAALAGMVGAFCLALVAFSLPAAGSVSLQAAIALAAPLFVARCLSGAAQEGAVLAARAGAESAPGPNRAGEPSSAGPARAGGSAPVGRSTGPARTRLAGVRRALARLAVPPILAAVLVLFMAGMQFTYVNLGEDCDWSTTFALAAAVSLAVLLVETRFLRASRLSLLDIMCSLMIAVPTILIGTGTVYSELAVSMASIGMYLFLPRVLQIAAAPDEDGPLPGAVLPGAAAPGNAAPARDPAGRLAGCYLLMAAVEALVTLLVTATPLMEPAFAGPLAAGSIAVGMGCVLSVFLLYEGRTRAIIYGFVEAEDSGGAAWQGSGPGAGPAGRPERDKAALELACARAAAAYRLTGKEALVLRSMADGRTLQEIARDLGLSMGTMKSHAYHIYQKMDVHSRAELAARLAALAGEPGEEQAGR